MESTSAVTERARRPGGRTADVTQRINAAIVDLLAEGGLAACTFSNVAERAHVERSTLYRRFPDRWAAMIDAIIALTADETPGPTSGSFATDLSIVLNRTAEVLASPLGPAVWAVGAALRAGSAPEHAERFWGARRRQLDPLFDAAVEGGELPPTVDREELFAFAAGAVHFRMLIIGQRPTPRDIDRIVERVCALYCLNRNAAAGSSRGRTAKGRG